jgi:glycosyltransferase involved in cell wall biosynthesis
MHIVFVIANNSSVPYFKWFAEEAAKNRTHQFSFIMLHSERPNMIDDAAKCGWKCHWIKFDNDKRKSSMISSFFKLYSLFREIKPDVVHSHLFDDSLPTLLAARIAGVRKRVITKQDTTFHYYYAPKWVIADKFNNWNATDLIPVSKEAEDFIIDKENADQNKITMIHHGIPSKIFTKQTEEYKKELIHKYQLENKIVIGTVARLIEWKGYRYIIEAAEKVVKEYPNAVFLFVGEGAQKNELIELAKKYGVYQNIIFAGWVERTHIPSLYAILDVYAHAASFEPFGFVIPEAMMNAAPVVSTPTGSALDSIIHKKNGYLVKYKDSSSLAEGILYTIKHGNDFKEKGKKTALEMFEFDVMYNNYIKLYEK